MKEFYKYMETLDESKIYREELGTLSLISFKPRIEELKEKLEIIKKFENEFISQNFQNNLKNIFNQFQHQFDELIKTNENQFADKKSQFINGFNNNFHQFDEYFNFFAIKKLYKDGFLNDNDLLLKVKSLQLELEKIEQLKIEIKNEFNEKQIEFDNHVKTKITEIRKTSSKISIKVAQDEFTNAIDRIKKNIKLWSIISGGLIFSITVLLIVFYCISDFTSSTYIYQAIYKVSLVGFLATLLTYSLKILKSNIHLKEANYHKQVMTNSLKAFVESGSTDEQRDIILIKILESLTNLGNTGLVETNSDSNQKMTFEYLTKYLSDNK